MLARTPALPSQVVKSQAFYMKRALDQRNLRDGLKHASTMLGELRTSVLGPKAYYDLYISVTDELRHLEAYISSEHKRGRRMLELYELVHESSACACLCSLNHGPWTTSAKPG